MQYAGKDATKAFESAGHSLDAMKKKQEFLIGTVAKNQSNLLLVLVVLGLLLIAGTIYKYY